MPQRTRKPPKGLRPYTFHKVYLDWERAEEDEDENVAGDCPFCGRERKFIVNSNTGVARCFVCGIRGSEESSGLNHKSFVRRLWEKSYEETSTVEYEVLADQRNLKLPDTLMKFGIAKSCIDGEWLIPAYDSGGRLRQLCRYVRIKSKGTYKYRCLQMPEMGPGLFGITAWNDPETIFICEGPFDAVSLYEALEQEGMTGDNGVVGVPGVNIFDHSWADMFAGVKVNICFDNDHPGDDDKSAGLEGVKRVASILSSADDPPTEINYLSWGKEGYSEKLPNGADVSDLLTGRLSELLKSLFNT